MKYEQQTKRIAQAVEKLANKSGPNTKYDDDIKRIADALALIIQNGGTIGGGGCQCEEKFKNYYTRDEVDEILIDLSRSQPVILNINHISIDEGDAFDPMDGVQALDHEGDDITHLVTVSGTVDTDTPGEYTLTYSVSDDKGKSTTVERIVTIVEWNVNNFATVLFADGHLMINEKKANRDADIAVHGAVTNEYIPWDKKNPDTSYVFTSSGQRPWFDQRENIKTVSAGSLYKPKFAAYMFAACSNLTTIDVSNWDTSALTNAKCMFESCKNLTTLDLSNWDTSALTDAFQMFAYSSSLTVLDLSNWDTSALTDAFQMFAYSSSLTVLDLSNWDTSALTDTRYMFQDCTNLTTIYASNTFVVSQITRSTNMFNNCTNLVGGAGTVYNRARIDKTYARIDNPPSAPGYFTAKP